MTKEEREELSQTIRDAMESTGVDAKTHRKHHEYIDTMIIDARRKSDTREAITKQVYGWGIIMFISGIGIAVWQWFDHFIHKG